MVGNRKPRMDFFYPNPNPKVLFKKYWNIMVFGLLTVLKCCILQGKRNCFIQVVSLQSEFNVMREKDKRAKETVLLL